MFHKEGTFQTVVSSGKNKKKSIDTPLRKSDRRKLHSVALSLTSRRSSMATFDDQVDTDQVDSILNTIFLDDTLSVRKVQLPDSKAQVYLRSSSGNNDNSKWPYPSSTECVWLSIDLGPHTQPLELPSLTTLSLVPTMLPIVYVHPNVSKYLCRGAHLMRAGIRQWPAHHSGVVAVCVQGNPQPFAVGLVTNGTNQNTVGVDAKGIGVEIWTCYGDDIWRNTTKANAIDPDGVAKQSSSSSPSDASDALVNPCGGALFGNGHYGNVGFIDGKGVLPIRAIGEDGINKDEVGGDDQDGPTQTKTGAADGEEHNDWAVPTLSNEEEGTVPGSNGKDDETTELSTDDHDALLHDSTCQALIHIKDKDLPMVSSTFYSNHILKHRPPGRTIELKKTSYKKLGTYLLAQAKRNLIQVAKQGTNPAGFLKSVDRRHSDLRGRKKDPSMIDSAASKKKPTLTLVNLHIIPHHFVDLLRLNSDDVQAANAKTIERQSTGMLTRPEIRAILDKYVETNGLVDEFDRSEAKLDGPLTDALFGKEQRICAPDIMSRKDLHGKWLSRMEPAYAIVQMPGNKIQRLARGSPPKVTIEVSTRSGRKFKTRIRGVEDFGIDGAEFIRDVAIRFACSGSVDERPSQKLKKGHVEGLFQGHWAEEIKALLLGDPKLTTHGGAKDSPYAIPKHCVDVVLRKKVPARKKR